MRFAGKTVIITGGAGGLGSAIAMASAEQGASVGILDTNHDAIGIQYRKANKHFCF